MKKKKPTIKKYAKGGNFFDKAGQFALNGLRSNADIALSMFGADNVIQDSDYTGYGAEGIKNYSNVMGNVGKSVAPMALSMVGVPPQVTSMGQKAISNSLNPMDEEVRKQQEQQALYNQQMNYTPQQFAMGGVAELEKQEVFKTPNGQIDAVNGPSHEAGGINVNIPNQTKILSDKLKLGKKTFAELGTKYKTVKEDKILTDDLATPEARATAKLKAEIKQKKLDELFNTQEQIKQSKLNKYAEKLGIQLPQVNSQFANQEAQQFPYGGLTGQQAYDKDRQAIINQYEPMVTLPPIQGTLDESVNYNETSNYDPSYENASMIADYKQTNPEFWGPGKAPKTPSSIPYGEIAGVAANLTAPIYSLATNKKEKPIGFMKPSVRYLDPSAELRSNNIENRNNINAIKSISVSGGDFMNNAMQAAANNSIRNANTITKYANANSGIYNDNQKDIANITNTELDYNRKDAAGYRNINRAAVSNLGENVSGTLKDKKLMQQDYKTLGMISNMYPNYSYDPKTMEWKHKQTGRKLTEEEKSKIYG